MAAAQKTQGSAPLPAKLAGLLREAQWLVMVAAAGYLLLILLTHHATDPGWSRSATAAVVQRRDDPVGRLRLRFGIFDLPQAPGPFRQRLELASAWFAAHPSAHAFVIAQQPVHNRAELRRELARIERLGGEGLIVRDPEALYLAGRRPEILKVKSFADGEAVVIEHLPGRGRNAGLLGALLVELPDGTRFKIGTGLNDEQRRSPPPLGTTITFKHHGRYHSGLPKFPVFLRIRHDLGL